MHCCSSEVFSTKQTLSCPQKIESWISSEARLKSQIVSESKAKSDRRFPSCPHEFPNSACFWSWGGGKYSCCETEVLAESRLWRIWTNPKWQSYPIGSVLRSTIFDAEYAILIDWSFCKYCSLAIGHFGYLCWNEPWMGPFFSIASILPFLGAQLTIFNFHPPSAA